MCMCLRYSQSHSFFWHTAHLLHCQHIDIPILFQNITGDALTSVEVSCVEAGTLFAKQQEIQEDLEELSNLEGSEYSFQTTMEELGENQKDNQLTLQEPQNNDNKKQLHEKMVSGRYNSSRGKTTMHHGTCRPARKLSVQRKVRIMRHLSYFSEVKNLSGSHFHGLTSNSQDVKSLSWKLLFGQKSHSVWFRSTRP